MSKNFQVDLTPQNEEWIKLIPNASKNIDIVTNKLLETSIIEGLLLEAISQSLTTTDLQKFKTAYNKMQAKRTSFMEDLDITPAKVERKKVTQTVVAEVEEEEIIPELEEVKTQKTKQKSGPSWDEDTF